VTSFADGSVRRRQDEPPLDALERGPVWVLDAVSAKVQLRGLAATVDTSGVLVVDGGLRIDPAEILYFELVHVADPEGLDPFGRSLWEELPGRDAVFVWIFGSEFD
jgi:hypothetical protein